MVWVGLAAVLVLCFCVFRYAVPAMTNRYLAPAIDPQHRMAGTPGAKVLSVGTQASPVAEKPAPLPFLMGVWLELRDGAPVVHALLEDGAEIPARWVTGFNLDGFPAPWVEANGVKYFLRRPKIRQLPEVVAAVTP